jgi:transforming growth factor-beta-induced protein
LETIDGSETIETEKRIMRSGRKFVGKPGLGSAALALAMTVGLVGCSEATVPEVELNLVETAASAGQFGTLLAAAEAAGLAATLSSDGPFTVFAPTDAAFAALPAGTLEAVLADRELLRAILLYHVVPGRVLSSDLTEGQVVTTAEGRPLRVTLSGGARVNGVNITATDVTASNGVIHVIDQVLLPVKDNVDTAIGAGFETLVAAVQAAGLEDVLRGPGPFTIFAPTDAAFAALPEGALESLLANPTALAGVLTYHVVAGRVFASDLRDGMEVATVGGGTLTITLSGGARVNGTAVVAADVFTANGVIHVIDGVLLP